MHKPSYERVVEILQDYVDLEAECVDVSCIRDILINICGVDKEEAEFLGFGWICNTTEDEDFEEDEKEEAKNG